MKLAWLFNGSMEAHHLLAAYAVVWILQGGYVAWIAWKRHQVSNALRPTSTLTPISRDRK